MTADPRLIARRHRIGASLLVSIVATVVAAAVHAAAGGGIPSVPALAVALLLSLGLGMLAVGRRLTRGRTAVGVLVDQVVFHSVFAFFGTASVAASAASAPLVGAGHSHGAPLPALAAEPIAGAPESVMAVSHLVAAVLAYGMLRSGVRAVETVLRALGRAVARALDVPVALAPLPRPRVLARAAGAITLLRRQLRLPEGRGPPLLAVV
ncbi:hypothetical protein [Microcella frigidaquae]|uniref:Uncharacterized protein n=1 Tax=Microcella frigidaquae TaxID=424758 RepID=A0A840XF45_9MICO|nr:hypothetical protein [Microcella frigidaquae]MBB5617122.1 hypothetical protein [Microcella frigidaquae]NHN45938.1 hypothetical protein [Microcella frigidaquae]